MLDFFSVPCTITETARRWALGVFCAGLMLMTGCEDPNEMFQGLWESTSLSDQAPFQGAPTVALGHYGLEVTGVVYFHEAVGQSKLVTDCPCAFVVHQGVDLDEAVVRFSTSFEAMGCAADGIALDWELLLGTDLVTEERLLEGTVIPSDGSLMPFEVSLRRVSRYISAADRLCPPESP